MGRPAATLTLQAELAGPVELRPRDLGGTRRCALGAAIGCQVVKREQNVARSVSQLLQAAHGSCALPGPGARHLSTTIACSGGVVLSGERSEPGFAGCFRADRHNRDGTESESCPVGGTKQGSCESRR